MFNRNYVGNKARGGFSLVELLVVIGVIAVLIGILLPTLLKARKQANTVACLSNLRQLAQASLMFAREHDGYLPNYSFNRCAITAVNGTPLSEADWGFRSPYWNWDYVLSQQLQSTGPFRCPTDDREGLRGLSTPNSDDDIADSYRMNASNTQRRRLHSSIANSDSYQAMTLASLEKPGEAILFADGTTGDATNPAAYHASTWDSAPGAGIAENYRKNIAWDRHRGSANYVFADGHADTLSWEQTWEAIGPQSGLNSTKQTAWRQSYYGSSDISWP